MNNKLKEIFSQVQAEEELKNNTRAFLAKKTHGYTNMRAGKRHYHVYAAACACFLFIMLGGRWLYFTPTSEISIDINPSIELSVNRFDQVIFVNSYNEDGQELSKSLNIKFKNYADAMEQILSNDNIITLLSQNEIMTITVTGLDEIQSSKILSDVEAYTTEQKNTYCYFAPSEEVAAAHDLGLSCGKYKAFLEVQLLDQTITPETIQGMTMREIRELIDTLSSDPTDENPPSDNCGNGHHGYSNGHGGNHENKRNGW